MSWKPKKEDYVFCIDCNMVIDLWKYDNLRNAGHEGHRVRELTTEEYEKALEECEEAGCF